MSLRSTVIGLGVLSLTVGLACSMGVQVRACSNFKFVQSGVEPNIVPPSISQPVPYDSTDRVHRGLDAIFERSHYLLH